MRITLCEFPPLPQGRVGAKDVGSALFFFIPFCSFATKNGIMQKKNIYQIHEWEAEK